MSEPVIVAEHRGVCPDCEDLIHPGEEIAAGQDGWRHRACRLAPAVPPAHPLCPVCHCYHAGECA